jgi:chromate transporter
MVAFFFGVKDSETVKAMLKAVRPVVVGLLLWTAYDMANGVFSTKKSAGARRSSEDGTDSLSWPSLLLF